MNEQAKTAVYTHHCSFRNSITVLLCMNLFAGRDDFQAAALGI